MTHLAATCDRASPCHAEAFGKPAITTEDALEALAVLSSFPNMPNRINRGLRYEATVGEVLRLSGDIKGALEALQRAAAPFEALLAPLEYVWSNLRLAEARETAGDCARACDGYARVLAAWGGARPYSRSAAAARQCWTALGCRARENPRTRLECDRLPATR